MSVRRVWGLLPLVLAIAAACRPQNATTVTLRPVRPVRLVTRNVEASDYVGSESCAPCHADLVQAFTASPMHRMTRDVDKTTLEAPFHGESMSLGDDRATLTTRDGARFVSVESGATHATLVYRVTRVIGGHHREDFVGVLEPRAPEESESDSHKHKHKQTDDELVLPVSYLIAKKRLRYKGYSVMVRERPSLNAGPVWNRTCIFCHNTVPLLSTLYGALGAKKTGGNAYQGEVVDRLLGDNLAFRYTATNDDALRDGLTREATRLGGALEGDTREGWLRSIIGLTRSHFTGKKLLEVGIGCEACHGGAREHVQDWRVRPSLVPRAPYLSVDTQRGAPSPAEVEDHACARCHQVLFSRYPWTWEGGRRNAMPGGSHISSGEGRDMLMGGCKGELRCTMCHDPHAKDDSAHLEELATPKGNDVCVACHGALREEDAQRKHSHHDPAGNAGACIACHMPKKNMSLEGDLSRYHRIGSPTDPDRVLGDRPLECALCHADKSVRELTRTMETWWKKSYDRETLRNAYGDLEANVLRATLERGKPHEKAVALDRLGAARDRASASLFVRELFGEYPIVRDYAATALRDTYGEACDIDLARDREAVDAAFARCSTAIGLPILGPARPALVEEGPPED